MGVSVRVSASSRGLGGGLALGLTVAFAACGNTTRSPLEDTVGDGGVGSTLKGGSTMGGSMAGGPMMGGFPPGSGGSFTVGGSAAEPIGGEASSGAGGASATEPQCIEGAPCRCGKAVGTVECVSGEDPAEARCMCPPESECRAPLGDCFEPCGGDPLGLWVLEETCFPGAVTSGRCAGATLSGTSDVNDLQMEVLENEDVRFYGGEDLDVRAQVPLDCLGIESVNRCADAVFYTAPLYLRSAQPLACAANACGFCECDGKMQNGPGVLGRPWLPGSRTLPFGDIDVPYCVDGDTMWAGGSTIAGDPKVSYKFRKRSCVGKPLPCSERSDEQCRETEDCQPGRCLPADDAPEASCEGLAEESCDSSELSCRWEPGGCWGAAAERCSSAYCSETPGCEWGEPKARCGGDLTNCFGLDTATCDWPGCSVRTCDVPDGWSGIDEPPCDRLTKTACAKAAGCTLNGSTCTGTTTCASQKDAAVCAMLECAHYDKPTCGGYTTRPCSELSVDDCAAQPGCRLEW